MVQDMNFLEYVFGWEHWGKYWLGRTRRRWENNIKMKDMAQDTNFLEYVRICELLMKDSVPWSWLLTYLEA